MPATVATTVVGADVRSAAEQISEHQRQLAGPDHLVKGLLVSQPRLHYIPPSSPGQEPINDATYDLSRTRIETGPPARGRRRRRPPRSPFTPYRPNNA